MPTISVTGRQTTAWIKYRYIALFEVQIAASEESPPPVDAQFLDGAAVVQMLNTGTDNTFLDYAVHVCCHIYIPGKLCSRVHCLGCTSNK